MDSRLRGNDGWMAGRLDRCGLANNQPLQHCHLEKPNAVIPAQAGIQ
jgi:hypothetical protein